MLKAEPLTVDEVNKYGGVGTDDNHVNKYTKYKLNNGSSFSDYAWIIYYGSETCGFVDGNYFTDGCKSDYAESDIKYVVDDWANDKFSLDDLVEDETGYSARLLTIEELRNNLGYAESNNPTEQTPDWLFHFSYFYYWTMSSCGENSVWTISASHGELYCRWTQGYDFATGGRYIVAYVRPVVTIKKDSIENNQEDTINENIDNKDSENNKNDTIEKTDKKNNDAEKAPLKNISNSINKNEVKTNVNVPDTLKKISTLLIMLGVTLVSISIVIVIKNRNIIKK